MCGAIAAQKKYAKVRQKLAGGLILLGCGVLNKSDDVLVAGVKSVQELGYHPDMVFSILHFVDKGWLIG